MVRRWWVVVGLGFGCANQGDSVPDVPDVAETGRTTDDTGSSNPPLPDETMAPRLLILLPVPDAKGFVGIEGEPVQFEMQVEDGSAPRDRLNVVLTDQAFTVLCEGFPDAGGRFRCSPHIGVKPIDVTVNATAPDGRVGTAQLKGIRTRALADMDEDGDGVSENEGDCDDANPFVAPGLMERCDGLDNDCDDRVDNDAIDCTTYYRDVDGDGYGDPSIDQCTCFAQGQFASTNTQDCFDSNASVYPGQTDYFSSNRGDGSYDYDCDGVETPRDSLIDGACAGDILQGCFVIEGWEASIVPACGDSGSYFDATSSCTLNLALQCSGSPVSRPQTCR
ncbi:MAG: putative metal-binding motif-containing protein [Myxococcota bacterium]